MNAGKTLFAQLMEFLPWKTFSRIVVRYGGDSRVRTLSCGEQYRAMAFAQLTYRESLRDIETCCRSRRRSCTTWASVRIPLILISHSGRSRSPIPVILIMMFTLPEEGTVDSMTWCRAATTDG